MKNGGINCNFNVGETASLSFDTNNYDREKIEFRQFILQNLQNLLELIHNPLRIAIHQAGFAMNLH